MEKSVLHFSAGNNTVNNGIKIQLKQLSLDTTKNMKHYQTNKKKK